MKTAVVYWSGTGNTAAMALQVAEGMKENGADVDVFTSSAFSENMMESYDAVAFGCPSMGNEQLEETEFQPLFELCIPKLKGQKIGLFGSYGWGDGEWMRNWEDTCRQNKILLADDGIICCGQPDDDICEKCRQLGKELAIHQ